MSRKNGTFCNRKPWGVFINKVCKGFLFRRPKNSLPLQYYKNRRLILKAFSKWRVRLGNGTYPDQTVRLSRLRRFLPHCPVIGFPDFNGKG
jgi:hypothetical protein